MKRAWLLLPSALSLALAQPARAQKPDVATCLAAHEGAQLNRRDRALIEAAAKLRVCASDSCPGMVRADCVTWFPEVERETPSVVLEAKGDEGALLDVLVTMDGQPLSSRLDGKQIALDPGVHRFRFEAPSRPPLEQMVVVRDGEKAQIVSASWETPKPPRAAEQPAVRTERYTPIQVYVIGGLGIGAVGAGTALLLVANGKKDDLTSSCKPFCTADTVRALRTEYIAGNVALGVGVAAIATALVLFVARPERVVSQAARAPARPAAKLQVNASVDGVVLTW